MSVLKKVFGAKKKKKVSTSSTEDAIQKLILAEELMIEKQKHLEKKIEHEVEIAKQNSTTNKRVALLALKRKKLYGEKLLKIDNTLSAMEQQREALECANINTNVLNTLKDSAGILKSAHSNMSISDVHEIMDDISYVQETSKEMSRAISCPISFDEDEDELRKELEELIQDNKLNKQLKTNQIPATNMSLPAVPTLEPSTRTKPKNDDNTNRLADWAS